MRTIVVYQIFLLVAFTCLLVFVNSAMLPLEISKFIQQFNSVLIGGLGGILYCIRGIYLNASTKAGWDSKWAIWYYLRPISSSVVGGFSFLVLKSGLLVLEASFTSDSNYYGAYLFAFIAGLNVDRFISKVEDLAKNIWGIEKSRTSQENDNRDKELK